MSDGTLDDRYLEWLYLQIGAVRNPNPKRSYWRLARQMYSTAFEWSVPNDDNRCEDGTDLRWEFLDEEGIHVAEPSWMGLQCSVLEMLIALSRRASFESQGTSGDWFWHLAQNLQVRGYNDSVYSVAVEREVSSILDQLVKRQYQPDGNGGLFPLRNAQRDQRLVELWYQMSAYMLEGDYIDHGPIT